MRVEIRAADEDGAAGPAGFYRWLREDPDGPGQLALRTRTTAGTMGAAEIVDLVLTHSAAAANLALAYAGWRRARGSGSTARLTFSRPADGLSVTVEDASDETVRQLLALLATPLPPGAPPSAPPGAPPARTRPTTDTP